MWDYQCSKEKKDGRGCCSRKSRYALLVPAEDGSGMEWVESCGNHVMDFGPLSAMKDL